ncbi:unnamed protein product [Albugo candida]|uniref:Inosine/uridine-preferring nucleoside hydrolase domain-containing protein n=1 Tax=Albugo candida TaxID=65357 RepID=A0A024GRJ2_9STRA|nr:unnamed protein product [Albugo candida]|eukprot:CCI48949.1 unnamed protein product [Albugo candida]
MARFKLRFQLMCGWALCLMSLIKCEQSKCLVVTDGEPDDMFSMILMAKSPHRKGICADGVIIILVWPTEDKKKFIKLIFDTAGIDVTILNGANSRHSDKNQPFDKIYPESHKKIKEELINANIRFTILIIAPLRDLSMVLYDLERNRGATFDNIRGIYWAGGWKRSTSRVSYNLFRDPEHTLQFMNVTALEKKIHISSSRVSMYRGSMNERSFPELIKKLSQLKESNALFKGLITIQEIWDKALKELLKGTELESITEHLGNGIQFCPADILATMLMFDPSLATKEEFMYYTVKVVKADPKANKVFNWDSMTVSVKSNQAEKEIENQRARIANGEKFHDYEILYQHQLYTKIADHPQQEESTFKQKVISWLEEYVPQEQQTIRAQ